MLTDVSANAVVRFGVFEADLRSGELRKSGTKVKIQDLPFRALKALISQPNEVLSREDLRRDLWPDGVYVDFDRGVISAINRLRDALGDSAENPVFIETVGRRGYRWIAPTHISELPAETTVVAGIDLPDPAPARSFPWKLVLVLPVLAVLVSAWLFWKKHGAVDGSAPASTSASTARHAAKGEAEEFYLKGRYYWEKRTPDSLNKAVDSFTQAIVHDPNYAQAYVGLADCYNLLREYTVMPSSEAYPRALAAAKRAVELDPQSSEAHASLAFVSFFGMWDIATADREFRRAIELNPSNATAHHWYATYLLCLRRFPESLVEIERAQALDPASKSVLADKGAILLRVGQQQEGIALLKQLEENEPDSVSAHRYLKYSYLQDGDYRDYLSESRKEAELTHDAVALAVSDAAGRAFAAGGGRGMLEQLRREQKKRYARGDLSPYLLAETCALLGNKTEALQYLKIAYGTHSDGLAQVEANPTFEGLHNDPGFRQLVAQVGLPPLS
jgi:DNA-binding winged helix-turn-helix (wHTH) protein/Tfp pilus assembly protein PilF